PRRSGHAEPVGRVDRMLNRSGHVEVDAEALELAEEVLIATLENADPSDGRPSLRGERGDDVRETAPQVWDLEFGPSQRCRAGDDRGVLEVQRLAEPARCGAEALAVDLD